MTGEPHAYAWICEGRLAVAERPGGGGRAHRIERREQELAWWWAHGIRAVVSGMRTRHGLLDAALGGFRIAWHPLVDVGQAARELPGLVASAVAAASAGEPALVHVDRPGEWLAAVDAALRRELGLAADLEESLRQARGDGLPVGPTTLAVLGVEPGRIGRLLDGRQTDGPTRGRAA